jgi:hypothetical protein
VTPRALRPGSRSRVRSRTRPLALAFAALLLDCATLDPLPGGTCGNKVIDDATEDCDGEKVGDRACGAPSSGVTACRLLCAVDADCPGGWGCAHEGYCRAPTGQFAKVTDAVSSEVTSMSVGDFDGDRRDDILASGPRGGDNAVRTKILYFGPGGALEHTNALSAPIVSPEPHDFDGDGIDDFSFGSGGFAIIRGQSDRSLVPVTFPSFRVPTADVRPIYIQGTRRALPTNPSDTADPLSSKSFLLAGTAQTDKGVVDGLFSIDKDSKGSTLAISLPVGPDKFVGAPIAGNFLSLEVGTCEDVIVAMNTGPTSGEIDIISPCRGNRWADEKDLLSPVVKIKVSEALVGGDVLAKINAGSFLDLMYGTASGVFVIRGNGTKLLANAEHVDAIDFHDVPLAVADIDNDGRDDFVTPTGVVLSVFASAAGPGDAGSDAGTLDDGGVKLPPHLGSFKILGTEYFALPSARRTRWTAAVVGDLNHDGLPDIAAGSSEVPDLDLMQIGADGITTSTMPTNGPVRFLALGDFDGDQITDIAFAESRIATGDFAVMYAYGRSAGPPEPPQIVGRLPDIVDLHVVAEQVPSDLDLFSREAAAPPATIPTLALAALLGSGDRQPLAPLLLARPGETLGNADVARQWIPMAVHAGKFVDPTNVDMFALATGYTFTTGGTVDVANSPSAVWLAKATDKLTFDSASYVGPLPKFALIDPATQVFEAPTTTGDLDSPPDGLLESVSLVHLVGDPRASIAIVKPSSKSNDAQTFPMPDQTTITSRSSVRVIDVDGDGKNDIVVVLTVGAKGAVPSAPTRAFVYFNGGGTFDATKPIEIVAPPGAADTGPAAVSLVTTAGASASGGGNRTRELAVVTQHRLLLATAKADRSGFDYRELTSVLGKRGLVSGTGVTSGDFDGDGVEDLAIADAGSVRLLLQTGRLP